CLRNFPCFFDYVTGRSCVTIIWIIGAELRNSVSWLGRVCCRCGNYSTSSSLCGKPGHEATLLTETKIFNGRLSSTPSGWFDRLVKAKMADIAVGVAGIGIASFLLVFGKLFEGSSNLIVTLLGIFVMITSVLLFSLASVRHVVFMSKPLLDPSHQIAKGG